MVTNYAEIGRAGILEADLQRSTFIFFSEIFTILLRTTSNSKSAKKDKKIFSCVKIKTKKERKRNHFTIEIA